MQAGDGERASLPAVPVFVKQLASLRPGTLSVRPEGSQDAERSQWLLMGRRLRNIRISGIVVKVDASTRELIVDDGTGTVSIRMTKNMLGANTQGTARINPGRFVSVLLGIKDGVFRGLRMWIPDTPNAPTLWWLTVVDGWT